jgi:osmotically inducible protein OsmC
MAIVAGHAQWNGSFKEGTGTLTTRTTDTIRSAPYTFASRFEGAPGAIPEELVATGHAGCYNHALANIAFKLGITVESIATTAELAMGTDGKGSDGHGYSIEGVHLVVQAHIPGVSDEQFATMTEEARTGCSISKALRVPITLTANRAATASSSTS